MTFKNENNSNSNKINKKYLMKIIYKMQKKNSREIKIYNNKMKFQKTNLIMYIKTRANKILNKKM